MLGFAGFYYDGDCNDPNVQDQIKQNYLTLLNSPFVPPFFCEEKPDECNVNTIEVSCGEKTAAQRRRRRNSEKVVSIRGVL